MRMQCEWKRDAGQHATLHGKKKASGSLAMRTAQLQKFLESSLCRRQRAGFILQNSYLT